MKKLQLDSKEKWEKMNSLVIELHQSTNTFNNNIEEEIIRTQRNMNIDRLMKQTIETDQFYKDLPQSINSIQEILNENLARRDCLGIEGKDVSKKKIHCKLIRKKKRLIHFI